MVQVSSIEIWDMINHETIWLLHAMFRPARDVCERHIGCQQTRSSPITRLSETRMVPLSYNWPSQGEICCFRTYWSCFRTYIEVVSANSTNITNTLVQMWSFFLWHICYMVQQEPQNCLYQIWSCLLSAVTNIRRFLLRWPISRIFFVNRFLSRNLQGRSLPF